MYSFIKGKVVEKIDDKNLCVVEVNGLGYEIVVSNTTFNKIVLGEEKKFYVVEISGGLYSNNVPTLYGFLSTEEKEIFLSFKNNLTNVGPKKALEYLDKVEKNISEFRRAVKEKNYKVLTSLFNFRHSSAVKIVDSLNSVKTFIETATSSPSLDIDVYSDLVDALVNLGYKEQVAKIAVEKVLKTNPVEKNISSEKMSELIKLAIKEVSIIENK